MNIGVNHVLQTVKHVKMRVLAQSVIKGSLANHVLIQAAPNRITVSDVQDLHLTTSGT